MLVKTTRRLCCKGGNPGHAIKNRPELAGGTGLPYHCPKCNKGRNYANQCCSKLDVNRKTVLSIPPGLLQPGPREWSHCQKEQQLTSCCCCCCCCLIHNNKTIRVTVSWTQEQSNSDFSSVLDFRTPLNPLADIEGTSVENPELQECLDKAQGGIVVVSVQGWVNDPDGSLPTQGIVMVEREGNVLTGGCSSPRQSRSGGAGSSSCPRAGWCAPSSAG